MKRLSIAVVALALVAGLAVYAVFIGLGPAHAQLADSSWPMFQHDPQHTGRSPHVGPQSNVVRCDFPVSGGGLGSPAIGPDGTIYVPTGLVSEGVGYLYAVNPDCTQKWVFQLPGAPASTAPAIAADGTIYIHANGPQNLVSIETLTAVNPDGTMKWQFQFNGGMGIFTDPVQSSPAIAPDGTIYIGSEDTNLYALNPDGTIKWAVSPTISGITSSPAIGPDGTIYIMDATCTLFAFAPDGDSLWSFPLSVGTCYDASPTVGTDGTIYMGGPFEQNLYAINSNGTLKCTFLTGSRITSTPAIATDGTIYVGSDGLYALNPDCSLKWKFPSSTVLFSSASPVIGADDTIYWRKSWTAYAVNPDGTQKWSLGVDASPSNMLDPSGAIGGDGTLWFGESVYSEGSSRLRAIVGVQGDANGDGETSMVDAMMIAQVVVGLRPPEDIDQRMADVNCSGGVSMVDAMLVAQYVVGLIDEFPCSSP